MHRPPICRGADDMLIVAVIVGVQHVHREVGLASQRAETSAGDRGVPTIRVEKMTNARK